MWPFAPGSSRNGAARPRAPLAWLAAAALVLCGPAGAGGATETFRLSAPDGRIVTPRTFAGRVWIVMFGFTSCPDVCPTMLGAATAGVRQMGPAGRDVRILFVSVDPRRDTPPVLRAYAAAFGQPVLAVSGSRRDIDTAVAAFNARYALRPNGDGGYDVTHSGYAYLLDRTGRVQRLLPPGASPRRYADELARLVAGPNPAAAIPRKPS